MSSTLIAQSEISNHFNGEKFINPTLEKQFSPGFSEIFKMIREGRPNWQRNVKNTATPQLKGDLRNGDIAITFVNHATFLIQTSKLTILTDPVWNCNKKMDSELRLLHILTCATTWVLIKKNLKTYERVSNTL